MTSHKNGMSEFVNGKNDGVNEAAPDEDDIFEQDIKYEAERDRLDGVVDATICPNCHGEGTTLLANDNDENDKDFGDCAVCGGSGELMDIEDGELGEEEWNRLAEDAEQFANRDQSTEAETT